MVKVVLYGAGNYCDRFFHTEKLGNQEVLCIVDGNSDKWGQSKFGYPIVSPDKLGEMEFERLIITVQRYDGVLIALQKRNLPLEKIYIYNAEKNVIIEVEDIYEQYLERKLFREHAEKRIKSGLFMEALREKEFDGYTRILVFGRRKDYKFVSSFFETVMPRMKVQEGMYEESFLPSDKLVFCGPDYQEQLKKIRGRLFSERQWMIVPLFDVENTIIL